MWLLCSPQQKLGRVNFPKRLSPTLPQRAQVALALAGSVGVCARVGVARRESS